MAKIPLPHELLTQHIAQKAQDAGVPWDTYHGDFLIGCVIEWLSKNESVLTPDGIVKKSWL